MQALQTLNETGRLAEIKLSAGEKEGRSKRDTAQDDVRIFCKSFHCFDHKWKFHIMGAFGNDFGTS